MTIQEEIQKDTIGHFTDGRPDVCKLSKDISFKEGKILHLNNVVFGEIDEKGRVINIDRRKALESGGKLNPLLSHCSLATNATYIIIDLKNKHQFTTDNLGRIVLAEFSPVEIYNGRLPNEQSKALRFKDEDTTPHGPKQISDEGGHILADSAGGLPEGINIFPQAYAVNHSAEWRAMEIQIKNAVTKGKNIEVTARFKYSKNCRRPTEYKYSVEELGIVKEFIFENLNKEK